MENKLRIVIADDHPLVRRFVREVLEAEGWQVCGEAADGRQAVDLAGREIPDLVVLDLSMPVMNGFDAARHILKAHPGMNVLMLTMYDAEELVRAASAIGARGCVLKSDLQRLVAAVRALQIGRQAPAENNVGICS
jgi:DNA-binding NarL/FixJ family response regulator